MSPLASCVPHWDVGTHKPAPAQGGADWGSTEGKHHPSAAGDEVVLALSVQAAQPGRVIFPCMSNPVFLEPIDNIFPWQMLSLGLEPKLIFTGRLW